MIGLNGPVEALVIRYFLNSIKGLDSCVPVLVMLRAVLGPERLDDLTTTSDRVTDEQKPNYTRALGFRVVVREGSKARVITTAEYRPETKVWIDYKGREFVGCAAPKLGKFLGPAQSPIRCLEPVEYLDRKNRDNTA